MTALLLYPTHANCQEVLTELRTAGIEAVAFPLRCLLGKLAVSTNEVARETGLVSRTARLLLSELEGLRIVRRSGSRSGWILVQEVRFQARIEQDKEHANAC